MSWEATCGRMPIGAQHGRGRIMFADEARFGRMNRNHDCART